MEEMFEKLRQHINGFEQTIERQKQLIASLEEDKKRMGQDMAELKGRNIELEAKWSKVNKLFQKGVQ